MKRVPITVLVTVFLAAACAGNQRPSSGNLDAFRFDVVPGSVQEFEPLYPNDASAAFEVECVGPLSPHFGSEGVGWMLRVSGETPRVITVWRTSQGELTQYQEVRGTSEPRSSESRTSINLLYRSDSARVMNARFEPAHFDGVDTSIEDAVSRPDVVTPEKWISVLASECSGAGI